MFSHPDALKSPITEDGSRILADIGELKVENCGVVGMQLNFEKSTETPLTRARLLFDSDLQGIPARLVPGYDGVLKDVVLSTGTTMKFFACGGDTRDLYEEGHTTSLDRVYDEGGINVVSQKAGAVDEGDDGECEVHTELV